MEVSLLSGARTLSKGLRTSDPKTAAFGAALLALVVIRRLGERDTLVHVARLHRGQSLRVVVSDGDRPGRTL